MSMEESSDDEQLEMLLGFDLRADLQTLGGPRDVVNLPASNDSDSDSDSMNEIFLLDDNWAVMSQSVRPRYSFKCQQLIECPFTRQPKINIFNARMQGRLHLVARNFNLLTVVSYPRFDVHRRSHHQVWSYTPATNRWKLDERFKHNMHALQHMRMKAFLNTDGNELLIYFADDANPRIGNGFVVHSIDGTNAICRADEGVLPRAGYGAAYVSHQHFMYVIGGTLNSIPVCDVHRYDFHKRLWQVLYKSDLNNLFFLDFPKGCFGHQVITDGKFIYCLGGGDIDMQLHDFKHILTFNLTTHTWLEHHTQPDPDDRMLAENEGYPRARQLFACVQRRCSNGDIEAIICGGQEAQFFSYLSDIWKLNLCTMKWTHLLTARTPLPTYISPAALMRNACLFVFGGVKSKDNWAPRPGVMGLYKMWLTVPKLSELAWEAYSYYNDLKGRDRQELITLGIPSRFVERLPPIEPSPELADRRTKPKIAKQS